MCGIIGFTGNEPAKDIIIGGLERLEYRGYDSAGLALLSNDQIQVRKRTGKVEELRKLCEAEKMPATCGIGHTRWATHGGVTDVNAHPHRVGKAALYIGNVLAGLLYINDLARNERFIGTVIAAVIFFCLGVRLIVKAIKNERVNEHREENLGFKRFWRMAAVTSIYTLLTGIAFGFLETNLMVILIMIVCLTIAVVIMGTYTGYHFGFEHKRKAYVGGAILLWIAGFDVVFRYAMM